MKIRKVKDQLKDSGVDSVYLDGAIARDYVDRYFSMNFTDKIVSMTNFKVDDESISMGLTPILRSTIPRCRLTSYLLWTTSL